MKECPYCSEEIKGEALKCRYCGEWLNEMVIPIRRHIGMLPWTIIITVIAVIISGIALYVSWKAYNANKEANLISKNALTESTRQFRSINKPIILVRQDKFGEDKGFFNLERSPDGRLKISTLTRLENIGSIIAGNVFIHDITVHLFIDGNEIGKGIELKNKPANEDDNLSFIHIPPKESIANHLIYTFEIPEQLQSVFNDKERIGLIQNILVYYYPDSIPTPNKEANEKLFSTNITHQISYNYYSTRLLIFSDKPSLTRLTN